MLNVLINAYAVSPNWGSEPGMAWKWISELSKACNLFIITEAEWQKEIKEAVEKHPNKDRIHFYFNPVTQEVRDMCWNQGDWRFYYYYEKWQKKAYVIAKEIVKEHKIDVLHQLNMIGCHEPGYLWKLCRETKKEGHRIPLVWGPIGGLVVPPLSYLPNISTVQKLKYIVKDLISRVQRNCSPRLVKAFKTADVLVAANSNGFKVLSSMYPKKTRLINEAGCYELNIERAEISENSNGLNLLWVGRFISSKLLDMSIEVMSRLKDLPNVKLHIVGFGTEEQKQYNKSIIEKKNVSNTVIWHGKKPNTEVHKMMQSMDLFFFTSIDEGTPHVILECVQNQLPVLCFDTCGQGDVINDKVGIKIPLTTPEDSINKFESIIRSLAADKSKIRIMSDNCKSYQKHLTWASKADKMLGIYNSLIEKSK